MTRRGALGLLAAILTMSLVGWMYLRQASEMAEGRRCIEKLRQRKEALQRQNDQLTYEIGRLASVERLATQASELGYVPVSQARFLVVAGYPAQGSNIRHETKVPGQSGPPRRTTLPIVVGWWRAVADQFENWSQTDQP